VAIEAGAGTGKSSTLGYILRQQTSCRTLLTAFNRSVVDDASARLAGRGIHVRTNHALASRHRRALAAAGKIGPKVTPAVVVDALGLSEDTFMGLLPAHAGAALALATVSHYCGSADDTLGRQHAVMPPALAQQLGTWAEPVQHAVIEAAGTIWRAMVDPRRRDVPASHDAYLKLLCLERPVLPYDRILVDEAQDTSAAMLSLITAQPCQVVIVGDSQQAVYRFRGAVNAMRRFRVDDRVALTQSFRFGATIARAANQILGDVIGSPLRLRGYPGRASAIAPLAAPDAIVCRTNCGVVGAVIDAARAGIERIGVIGGTGSLQRLVQGVQDIEQGRATRAPELMGISSLQALVDYSVTEQGREFALLVRLYRQYGAATLLSALARVRPCGESVQLVVSTAHRAKGAEFATVQLADDFVVPVPVEVRPGTAFLSIDEQEGNLLYVAVTRAQDVLDVSRCSAFSRIYSQS
jgi:hypothetical protein